MNRFGAHRSLLSRSSIVTTAYTNFIARVSVDDTHAAAYRQLFYGLTMDGFFDASGNSNLLDVLYIFRTADSTTALLNLVANTFAATAINSPTFTADSGYTTANTGSKYIDSNYNPSTNAVNSSLNSSHMGVWIKSGAQQDRAVCGTDETSPGSNNSTNLYPFFSDNNMYARLNDGTDAEGFTVSDSLGHSLANRSSSTARQGYRNASSIGTYASNTSGGPANATLVAGAARLNGSITAYDGVISAIHYGASLTAVQVTQIYNRLNTYMSTFP